MYPQPNTITAKSAADTQRCRVTGQLKSLSLVLICLCFCVSQVQAFDFLSANGSHPLSGLIGIPQARFLAADVGSSSRTPASSHDVALSIQSDHSNIFAGGVRDGEFVLLDGETTRNTVSIVSRIGSCLQVAADFKQVSHREGSLDSLIEKWHDFFQLPDAQRDQTERDRLLFIYESDGVALTLDSATRSLGDTVLQLAYHSDCGFGGYSLPGALWFAGINLPTGSLDDLSGTGELTAFFGLQSNSFAIGSQLTAGTRLGLLVPREVQELPTISSLVAFSNIGIHWQPEWLTQRNTRLTLQLDLHSPLFQSTLRELGNYSVQLAIGGQWKPTPSHEFSLAFLEDVAIDTSPDLVFHLQYRYAF